MTSRLPAALVLVISLVIAATHGTVSAAPIPGGALDVDCSHVGRGLGGPGYQFIVTCPGSAFSPDKHWAVEQRTGISDKVFLKDRRRGSASEIQVLEDEMPFVVFWSPNSKWFFVNHYLGSGQDQLRPFEIVDGRPLERASVYRSAALAAAKRYPCLRPSQVAASGWKWSPDSQRIAMVTYARSDACVVEGPAGKFHAMGNWEVLWMIGDVHAGRIDQTSIRIRKNGTASFPRDGEYAEFQH